MQLFNDTIVPANFCASFILEGHCQIQPWRNLYLSLGKEVISGRRKPFALKDSLETLTEYKNSSRRAATGMGGHWRIEGPQTP